MGFGSYKGNQAFKMAAKKRKVDEELDSDENDSETAPTKKSKKAKQLYVSFPLLAKL